MSEVENDILNDQINESKRLIKVRDAVLRLHQNPDFKTVVLESYFRDECALQAMNASNPTLTREQREDILSMAMAAGHFKRFLSICVQKGNWGEGNIPRIEQEMEDNRVEELTGSRPEYEDEDEQE